MEHLLSAINEIENPLVTESRNHGGLSAFRLYVPSPVRMKNFMMPFRPFEDYSEDRLQDNP